MTKYQITKTYYDHTIKEWPKHFETIQEALEQARVWIKADDKLKSVDFKRGDFTLIYKRS